MKGIKIGHCNNDFTGVTVVICEDGATGGVDCRGGAPGTRETDLLSSQNTVDKINAVALCGGSAFGLAAADGVMRYLAERKVGFAAGNVKVPIVPGAVIFDINGDDIIYPDSEMGYTAAKNAAEDNQEQGSVGAGKGATVGKLLGPAFAAKGGVGLATVKTAHAEVQAIIVVNAFGHIFDSETGKVIAGAKMPDGSFVETDKFMLQNDILAFMKKFGANTTIGVVMTDAKLTKTQANKLASVAHNGLALSIKPVHTMLDGDTLFTMSTGKVEEEFNVLCVAAVEAVRKAVINAVTKGN